MERSTKPNTPHINVAAFKHDTIAGSLCSVYELVSLCSVDELVSLSILDKYQNSISIIYFEAATKYFRYTIQHN